MRQFLDDLEYLMDWLFENFPALIFCLCLVALVAVVICFIKSLF